MSSIKCSRSGAALVKVLIVLVVVVVAIGLMLSAMCKVREASARAKCANNLKWFAIALQNYASNNSTTTWLGRKNDLYPAGTIPNANLIPEDRLSWFVEVLPYIEHNELYSRIDRHQGWNSDTNAPAIQIPMNVFVCPGRNHEASSAPAHFTTYVGMAGLGADAPLWPRGDRRAGFFGYDRRTSIEDIKVGTSYTLLIVETARDNGPWAQGGWTTVRGLAPDDQPYLGTGKQFGGLHFSEKSLFKRSHPLGCNMALVDGSVRLVQENIDPIVLEGLATIDGGEKVGTDW